MTVVLNGMVIEFEGTAAPPGIEVYDPIEQRRLHVRTPEPVSPKPADEETFCFPVDTTCAVETASLVFDQRYSVHIHDESGQMITNLQTGDRATFDDHVQFVGLSGPIKLYCRVDSPGTIETGIDSVHLTFDQPVQIGLGGRSLHDRPAGTVRTPDDPESMMKAISALSSALKATTPERSWPTMRGHPPLIEHGDRLEIPSAFERPNTDVTVEIPPEYGPLYQMAPLAFYLSAEIRPGSEPLLRTPRFEYRLGETDRLENDVVELLKHVFLLDCVVRTEGLYQFDLYERNELEPKLPFDLAETYACSLPEQLERYLDVSYDVVEPYVPRWPLTAYVPSDPDCVEALPFVLNDLGIVREPRGETTRETVTAVDPEAKLVRSAGVPEMHRTSHNSTEAAKTTFVTPDITEESIEHAWFADHVPRNASKATIEGFRSQLDHRTRNESIEILVVCNDARMIDEHDLLDETYGSRETLALDVRSEFGIDSDRLASLLTGGGYDFLHYIGHATPEGLHCSDGKLDVRSLSSVDLGVFFLNACQSYEQGLALARRGAFGGVGTLGDVANEHAVEIGETMARLLNLGFPLRAALELVKESSVLGEQYLIVGDGSADIAQAEGGAPSIVELTRSNVDTYDYVLRSYSTKEFGVGTTTLPNLRSVDMRYLTPGRTATTRITKGEVENYLTWINAPVLLDGDVLWNDGIGPPLND